jgi:hypothetical protein
MLNIGSVGRSAGMQLLGSQGVEAPAQPQAPTQPTGYSTQDTFEQPQSQCPQCSGSSCAKKKGGFLQKLLEQLMPLLEQLLPQLKQLLGGATAQQGQ